MGVMVLWHRTRLGQYPQSTLIFKDIKTEFDGM